MNYTEADIIKLIKDVVYEVTNIQIDTDQANLLDTKYDIVPADYLYIFDILEQKLKIPVVNVLSDANYGIMQIDNLGKAFFKML